MDSSPSDHPRDTKADPAEYNSQLRLKVPRSYIDTEGNFVSRPGPQHNRLMWKVDLHVLPWLAIFYFLSFLDRVNIGNARLFNLESDLNMSGSDFNIALLAFFGPYILFEIPSNLVLRKVTPRVWLPSTPPSVCYY